MNDRWWYGKNCAVKLINKIMYTKKKERKIKSKLQHINSDSHLLMLFYIKLVSSAFDSHIEN